MFNISSRIYRIIRELGVNRNQINPNARLIEDIGLDSFDLCCLVNNVEYRCNIMINDNDISKFRTVGNIVDHVNMIYSIIIYFSIFNYNTIISMIVIIIL